MSWLYKEELPDNTMFQPDEFRPVTPLHVVQWMRLRCFGSMFPNEKQKPIHWRHASLKQAKKSLSYYMPHKAASWNPMAEPPSGNPTKSKEVNDLIKVVKQFECRGQGRKPQVNRPLEMSEYRCVMDIFHSTHRDNSRPLQEFDRLYRFPTMLRHQFHFICRADCLSHFELGDLQPHPRFPFALEQRVRWSKNVMEERDCPPQLIMGANDIQFCVLLGLAVYLESWFRYGSGLTANYLYTEAVDDNAPKRLNNKYRDKVNKTFLDPRCRQVSTRYGGKLGTHSVRKFAPSFSKHNGITKEEIEVRGRWRTDTNRVVDRYINVNQPYIDAKVASIICIGGPVKYVLREDSGITTTWLFENVVPKIRQRLGPRIAKVLALPLLWACLIDYNTDHATYKRIPISDPLRELVISAYEEIRRLPKDVNPVEKVSCYCVYG